MSAAIEWARGAACGGAAEKAVLLLLALRVGDGRGCVASRRDLAREGELGREAVERALVTLEGRGLIFRAARAETVEIVLKMEARDERRGDFVGVAAARRIGESQGFADRAGDVGGS